MREEARTLAGEDGGIGRVSKDLQKRGFGLWGRRFVMR